MPLSVADFLTQDTKNSAEILYEMLQKEETIFSCCDYLACSSQVSITKDDRLKMINWCFGTIGSCNFDRETVMLVSN